MWLCRTKNEKAEQVNRRMHKDGQMTKQMKEEIRKKNMIQRDIYDAQNLGRFHRCYPSADPVSIPRNNRLGITNEVWRAAQPRVSAVERIKWHQACPKCLNSLKLSSRRSHQHNIHEQKQSTRFDTYKIRVTTLTVLVVDLEMEAFV